MIVWAVFTLGVWLSLLQIVKADFYTQKSGYYTEIEVNK